MFIDSVANIAVTKVTSVHRLLKSPVGVTTYRYDRERWGIVLKREGRTVYTVGEKKIVSDGLHPVILPKGCSYGWSCVEPGECLMIEFDCDAQASSIISFTISDNSAIINAFSKIERSFNKQKPYYQLECYVQLYGILLFLAESTAKEPPHPKKHEILYPAVKHITENYVDSGITNDSLAALCQISTVYFRKTFEFVYGVSPIRYLHNFRINKAKAILLSDYESIEQVALSVGYNSIYHFSKMFKEYTGKSPTEYARQNKGHKNTAVK